MTTLKALCVKTSPRFNPALPPHVVAHRISKLTTRNLDRAIKKFSDFFYVDNDLHHVIMISEWYNFSLSHSDNYVFIVDNQSEYSEIALSQPDVFQLLIENDNEENTILFL